jgi:hypothetical protein
MQNVRLAKIADDYSAATFTPITDPFAAGYLAGLSPAVTVAHPYPQIFKGREATLMCTNAGVYAVTESTNWTVSKYTTVDAYDISSAKSITGQTYPNGSWHFADFGGAWALFNGGNVVFKTAMDTMFGVTSDVRVADDLMITTGCAFRGRMIMAGFQSTRGMWSEKWEQFLRMSFDSGHGLAFPTIPGTNYVWWSQIGDGAFFLLYPAMYIDGLITDDEANPFGEVDPMFWDMIERNEMGFMPMNWQGTVRCVKPLGNGIMVYGDNGISYMPKSDNTFGLVDLLPYGIESRSSVAGTEREHCFIDEAGWLWKIDTTLKPVRLGYREYFEPMLGKDITGHYDPIEDEYHFSASDYCFHLSGNRLFESTFLTTGLAVSSGGTVGLYARPSDSDKNYAILTTDTIDLGIRGLKAIERVVVSTVNTMTVSVAVQWRMKSSDSFTTTAYAGINYEGVAYFPITALEFRIIVRCTDYTAVDFDDIAVQFKVMDKRIVRGTYALEYRGGVQ